MKKNADAVDLHVGARVRLRRTTMKLSREKLAQGLGITFQQVQKYENGTNRVSASRLKHIASVLQVPVSYFFEGCPGHVVGEGDRARDLVTQTILSKDCVELTRAFLAIEDKRVQRSVLVLVCSLSQGKPGLLHLEDLLHATM